MKRKTMLLETTCKGCGKTIYTLRKAIHTNEAIRSKYSRICDECMSPEMRVEMNQAIMEAVGRF